MDFGKFLGDIQNNLVKAKNLSGDLAIAKGEEITPSRTGTGVHSPQSFGVSAQTGAPPASVRMAGGVGLQKIANSVISTGINKFVLPQVDKQIKNIASNIKTDLNNKNHIKQGGTFMHKPSVSM